MKNIGKKLAAVVFTMCVAVPSYAGKGGSIQRIQAAVQSGSQGAILAEVERTEFLICDECIQTLTNLTTDSRYAVREVAAWWFAKRPGLNQVMTEQMLDDLTSSNSVLVRNAADYLGTVKDFASLPTLQAAYTTAGLSLDAKLAIVRAVNAMTHIRGNSILLAATTDTYADVRAAAVDAWRNMIGQTTAAPLQGLLADTDAHVRAETAALMGAFKEANAATALQQLVVNDPDSSVRRNAAWALGKIGSDKSYEALMTATSDKSGLVSGYAKAALATLHAQNR
jgi:HEAT repeat protein